MDTPTGPRLPERNPLTHAEHKREVFWQITLPFIIGILLVLAAVGAIIFSATGAATDLGRWSSVSLIWLIMPTLFIALIFLVILVGVIYLVSALIRILPRYARLVQLYIELAREKIGKLANTSIEPLLKLSSLWATVRYAIKLLRNRGAVDR